MLWAVNPNRKRRRVRRTTRSKVMAKRKRTASRKRRRRASSRRRAVVVKINRPRRSRRRGGFAKGMRVNRRRGRRRGFRRNPGFSVRGATSLLREGAMGGVGVIFGRALTRVIVRVIPLGDGSPVLTTVKGALGALATGYAFKAVMPKMAPYALAGAFADVLSPWLQQVPVLGGFLGDDGDPIGVTKPLYLGYNPNLGPNSLLGAYAPAIGAPQSLGAYAGGFSAYPALVGVSGDEGE